MNTSNIRDNRKNKGNKKTPSGREKKHIHPLHPEQILQILDHISDGVLVFDRQMNYIYVNQKGAELLGRSPTDLIGKNCWQEFPEAIGTPFADAYARALETQQTILLEEYYPPFKRWFENRIYPWKDGLFIFFTDITERKRAEEELRAEQDKFKSVFEAANVGKSITLPHGKISVNNAFADMLGYSPEELADKTWQELTPPEEIATIEALLAPLLKGEKEAVRFEKRYIHKNGSYIWADVSVAIRRSKDGKPLYFITTIVDITERKLLEEELRRSEERFFKAFHTSPAGLTITRIADGKFVDANEAFCRMFEFSREEVIGHTSTELNMWSPEERKRLIEEQIKSGGLRNFELRARAKSGRFIDILFSSVQMDLAGEPHHITTMIDITERKRVEDALRESEERYRLLVDKSPYAIGVHQDGKIVFANPAAARLFGAKNADELIGKPIMELISPETQEAARQRIGRMLQGETGLYPTEDRYVKLNGTVVPVEVTAAPFTHKGRPAIQVIALDITERKRAEEKLRQSHDRLAELSRRLVEAHERERRAIGRELHDQIGQMLTALNLTLEIASQLPPEFAAKKLASAQELLNDLMSRVSALSLELRPPMLDDLGLLPTLIWHINRFQEQTQIEVEFKHSGLENKRFPAQIETTAYRVAQEALTNVARHARARRVHLKVRAGSDKMEIQIEDDGVGFDPQIGLAQGRGLAGMRERVGLVGGELQIESKTGAGSRISIRLPLKEAQT
jgi:PAS domain S-box-containing protein